MKINQPAPQLGNTSATYRFKLTAKSEPQAGFERGPLLEKTGNYILIPQDRNDVESLAALAERTADTINRIDSQDQGLAALDGSNKDLHPREGRVEREETQHTKEGFIKARASHDSDTDEFSLWVSESRTTGKEDPEQGIIAKNATRQSIREYSIDGESSNLEYGDHFSSREDRILPNGEGRIERQTIFTKEDRHYVLNSAGGTLTVLEDQYSGPDDGHQSFSCGDHHMEQRVFHRATELTPTVSGR